MRRHLYGNGAARTPSIEEGLGQIRAAGFEVKEHFDLMAYQEAMHGDDAWPWWADLQFNWAPHLLPVRAPRRAALRAPARPSVRGRPLPARRAPRRFADSRARTPRLAPAQAHPWVRKPLPVILGALSKIGLVPSDVPKVGAAPRGPPLPKRARARAAPSARAATGAERARPPHAMCLRRPT